MTPRHDDPEPVSAVLLARIDLASQRPAPSESVTEEERTRFFEALELHRKDEAERKKREEWIRSGRKATIGNLGAAVERVMGDAWEPPESLPDPDRPPPEVP